MKSELFDFVEIGKRGEVGHTTIQQSVSDFGGFLGSVLRFSSKRPRNRQLVISVLAYAKAQLHMCAFKNNLLDRLKHADVGFPAKYNSFLDELTKALSHTPVRHLTLACQRAFSSFDQDSIDLELLES